MKNHANMKCDHSEGGLVGSKTGGRVEGSAPLSLLLTLPFTLTLTFRGLQNVSGSLSGSVNKSNILVPVLSLPSSDSSRSPPLLTLNLTLSLTLPLTQISQKSDSPTGSKDRSSKS